MIYEEISKIIFSKVKVEEKQKPKTAEEIRAEQNNPMNRERVEELYNAILCYDESGNVCGYYIQPRVEENDIYKLRFYLPIVDSLWKGVRKPEDLPDKQIKLGYDSEFVSQNEVLKINDIKLGQAMFLNFKARGITYLGEGFVGISSLDTLYEVVMNFKFTGYPTNEATKEMNKGKLFV